MKKTTILLASLSICGVLAMSGCASRSASEQKSIAAHFQSGKMAFEKGQYTAAFNDLMPAASKGDAEAQYAIGYMYFYGKGTQQNVLLAKQWLEKSAKQRNRNAVTALNIINKKLESESSPFTGPTTHTVGAQNPVPMPTNNTAPPVVKTPSPAAAPTPATKPAAKSATQQ